MIIRYFIRLRGRNRAAKLRHLARDAERILADQRELQAALDRWNRADAAALAWNTNNPRDAARR